MSISLSIDCRHNVLCFLDEDVMREAKGPVAIDVCAFPSQSESPDSEHDSVPAAVEGDDALHCSVAGSIEVVAEEA